MNDSKPFWPMQNQVLLILLVLSAVFGMMVFPGWQWCFMGLVLATISHPWVKWIRSIFKSDRTVAVVILFSFLLLVSLVPLIVLILSVDVNSLADFEGIKSIVEKARESFEGFSNSIVESIKDFLPSINHSQVKTTAGDLLKSLSALAGKGVSNVLGAGPELAVNLFIFLITYYYALVSFRNFRSGILKAPVLNRRFKVKLMRSFSANAYSAIVATGATAAVQALILSIGMVSLGYRHWALGTLLAFIAAFVPVVGTLPVSAIVIIQFAVQGNTSAALIFLAIAMIAGISDNFIRPMFLKGSAHMHPWFAFITVLGGLSVFGFWGLFIGPILGGMLITTWKEWKSYF